MDVPGHDDPASAKVLTNTDLLDCIFPFVLWESPHVNRKDYVAQCAVVCRVFHEPAIRILWSHLNSLLPLWSLLAPPDIWFPRPIGGIDGMVAYIGRVVVFIERVNSAQLYLDPTLWDRFLWHATRVRRISYSTFNNPERVLMDGANQRLVRSVILQNGGNTVLPLLHTITWWSRHPDDDSLIPFFTPTLLNVTIELKGSDESRDVLLLRKLREFSPLLEDINISKTGGDQVVAGSSPIVQELIRFPRLRWIRVPRILGLEDFRALINIPNLTDLAVSEVIGPWHGIGHTISVKNLQRLSVSGPARAISSLFSHIRIQALQSATIRLNFARNIRISPADITNFLSLFYNAVSTGGLHTLDLSYLSTPPFPPCGYELTPLRGLLVPILPLRDLRTFSIMTIDTVTTLDDEDVEALACAWPNLERLSIDQIPTFESSMSFNALHYVHRHCHHLTELSIAHIRWPVIGVHALPAPVPFDGPALRLRSHPLRRLTVHATNLSNKMMIELLGPRLSDEGAEAMARYLLDLFPRLEPEQYKPAAQEDEASSRYGEKLQALLGFDGRWRRVSARVYALCRARDGL